MISDVLTVLRKVVCLSAVAMPLLASPHNLNASTVGSVLKANPQVQPPLPCCGPFLNHPCQFCQVPT